ncbi:MAG: hypothetical protein JXQ26_03920 [Tissierellales bacterium]|nr:hypothetical protein [Tissierellales bacterium]MBN2827109.1 hypothetical protein [Tissierellales bacterium]
MKKTILITHGHFGQELLKSVEMIAGKQEHTVAFAIDSGDDLSNLQSRLRNVINDNIPTYIFVDIFGGTPFNIAANMMNDKVNVITGVNLPMLLEYYLTEKQDIHKLIDLSKESIKYANQELGLI